jgi:hypothetical protein
MINTRDIKHSFLIFFTFFIFTNIAFCFSDENTGTLIIKSTPDRALVVLDKDTLGFTPLTKSNMYPKYYDIVLFKQGYFKKRTEANISANTNHHVTVKLISKKRVQNIRRISFGTISLISIGFSTVLGVKLYNAKNEKEKAWDNYMQLNHTTEEYDTLYKTYADKVNEFNRLIDINKTSAIVAGVFVVGFCISIPF